MGRPRPRVGRRRAQAVRGGDSGALGPRHRGRLVGGGGAGHGALGGAPPAHAVSADPGYLGTLRGAVERRHATLLDTAGLNAEVFDALVLLAAGSWSPEAIGRGWAAVRQLQADMDE